MFKWDERYRSDAYYYGTEANDFLKESADLIPQGGRVLCLAEGEGRNAVYLASRGFDVTAMDASPVGLEKLARLATERGARVRTVCADLATFTIEPASYDGIVAIWCHLPEPLRHKIHGASVRGLRKGGVFILEAYHPRQLEYKTGGPSNVDLLMTKNQLEKDLRGLRFTVLRETERDVQEGQGHRGRSAVVQVVGVQDQEE